MASELANAFWKLFYMTHFSNCSMRKVSVLIVLVAIFLIVQSIVLTFFVMSSTAEMKNHVSGGVTTTVSLCINTPPIIGQITDTFAIVGVPFYLQITAVDPDNDSITFGDRSDLFDINSTTGEIQFTPVASQAGITNVTITANDSCATSTKTFRLLILDLTPPVPVIQPVLVGGAGGGRASPPTLITKEITNNAPIAPLHKQPVQLVLALQLGETQAFAMGREGEQPRAYSIKLVESKDKIIIELDGKQLKFTIDAPIRVTLPSKTSDELTIIAQRDQENNILLTLRADEDMVLVALTNRKGEQSPATVQNVQLEQAAQSGISTSVLGVSTKGLATLLQRTLGLSSLEAQGLSNLLTIFLLGLLVGICLNAGIVYYFLKSRGKW